VYNKQVYTDIDTEEYKYRVETNKLCMSLVVLVVGGPGTPARLTRVIFVARYYAHARKHKKKVLPWGGVRQLPKWEAGTEM